MNISAQSVPLERVQPSTCPYLIQTTPAWKALLLSYGLVAKLWIYRVCHMICSVLCHQHHFIMLYIDPTVLSLLLSWKGKCVNVVIKELLFPKKCIQIRLGHKTTIGHTPSVKYLHVWDTVPGHRKYRVQLQSVSTSKKLVRMWVNKWRKGTEIWSQNLRVYVRNLQLLLLIFNSKERNIA